MKKQYSLWKYEKYFFLIIVIVSLVPILSSKYFPTIDGPAHLHNANLLRHIWFEGNTNLLQFFDFNQNLNSNLVNHVWFALVGLFLPSYLVEKSILIFYVIALPYSFRYLIKNLPAAQAGMVDAEGSWKTASYLIFPLVYSFPFCIGFFNFCIGIPIIFWCLGLWYKNKNNLNIKPTIGLTALITLLYFTHVFNFLLLGFILFFVIVKQLIEKRKEGLGLKQFLQPIIIFLPGMLLFLSFLMNNNKFEHEPPRYLTNEKLTEQILELGPIITLNKEKEIGFVKTIFYSLCLLVILVIVNNIRKRKEEVAKHSWFWFGLSLLALVIYFVSPDWLSSGGFISIRLALFFLLILVIWIAASSLPPIQLFIPVLAIVVTHTLFMNYHNNETKTLSSDATEATSAEFMMEENTVLLPLNYSDNWIHINYGSYVSTEKAIVNLDNYEATKPHFPLLWKKGESVYDLMKHYGDKNPPCTDIANYERVTKHRIDYVSRWCFSDDKNDSCSIETSKVLAAQFDLVYESPRKRLQLFKRKTNEQRHP